MQWVAACSTVVLYTFHNFEWSVLWAALQLVSTFELLSYYFAFRMTFVINVC